MKSINNTISFPGGTVELPRILEKRRTTVQAWIEQNNLKTMDEINAFMSSEGLHGNIKFFAECESVLAAKTATSKEVRVAKEEVVVVEPETVVEVESVPAATEESVSDAEVDSSATETPVKKAKKSKN